MPTTDIRLVLFTRADAAAAPAAAELEQRGIRVGAIPAGPGGSAPWPVFRAMEAADVYPPTAVVVVGDTVDDVLAGVNAAAWAVGVTDGSRELGLTAGAFAALPEHEREQRREQLRTVFFDAGADGVVDTPAELPGLINELGRLLAEDEEG